MGLGNVLMRSRAQTGDADDFESGKRADSLANNKVFGSPSKWLLVVIVAAAILLLILLGPAPGSRSAAMMAQTTDGSKSQCPLLYKHHKFEEVQSGVLPYLFGGRQQPNCTNCDKDHLWSNFCQFKSQGPICPSDCRRKKDELVNSYIDRNWTQLLTLTPCDLYQYLDGKTLWVMGDSQGLDVYKALKCFMFEFWDLEGQRFPVEGEDDCFPKEVVDAMSYILLPRCVLMPRGSRICYVRVDTGDYLVDTMLPMFPLYGDPANDLLLANFGLHHGKHEEYQDLLGRFADLIGTNSSQLPTVLWQQTPPQHFQNRFGEYPGGQPPFECVPFGGVELQADGTLAVEDEENEVLLHGGWRNKMATEVLGDVATMVQSYNESLPLSEYHRDNGKGLECSHYCFPGAPQTWVFALYRTLTEQATGLPMDPTEPFPNDDN